MQGSSNDHTSHIAAGAAAGFLFQLERAIYWLAESISQDALVGVETLADIFVSDPAAGANIHEEDKHSIRQQGHPFGDRDKRLWRTLEIWCDATCHGTTQEQNARLLLVTNRPVASGLATELHAAFQDAEVQACINAMRKIADSPPLTIADTAARVMDYEEGTLMDVIRRIELCDASTAISGDELRNKTVGRLHLPSDVDAETVIHALTGWLQDVLLHKWRSREPGWITRRAFDTCLHRIVRELRRDRVVARAARYIQIDPDEKEAHRQKRFVEHLAQIAAGDKELESAIEDYLRFSSETFRLLDAGEIMRHHWEERADRLHDRWQRISLRARRRAGQQELQDVGQEILDLTLDPNFTSPLADNDEPEPYFTRGHYHRIADEDRVWWYPCDRPDY